MKYLISAERPEYSVEQNRERSDQLATWLEVHLLAGNCTSVTEVAGVFEGMRKVNFMVTADIEFMSNILDMGKAYEQDAIITINENGMAMLFGNLHTRGLMFDVRLQATGQARTATERPDGDYTELPDGMYLVVDFE